MNPVPYHTRRTRQRRGGFTLAEVLIAMFLISLMCLSVLSGLQAITKMTMGVAIRSEAFHLLQAEAERLTSVAYGSFTSSSDQTITGCFKTSFLPSTAAQFSYPATGSTGRVTFTRRVVDASSTTTTKTLRVEVQWTWQGRTSLISTQLFRGQ